MNDTELNERDETKRTRKDRGKNCGHCCLRERWNTRGPPPHEAAHGVYIARPVATYSPDHLSLALGKGVCPENERAMTRVRCDVGNGETAYASLGGMVACSLSRGVDHVGQGARRSRTGDGVNEVLRAFQAQGAQASDNAKSYSSISAVIKQNGIR